MGSGSCMGEKVNGIVRRVGGGNLHMRKKGALMLHLYGREGDAHAHMIRQEHTENGDFNNSTNLNLILTQSAESIGFSSPWSKLVNPFKICFEFAPSPN